MKLPKIIALEQFKRLVDPTVKFYMKHQSVFLTGQTIGFSITANILAIKNGKEIINTIDIAKECVYKTETKEERINIYTQAFKDLVPLLAPIIFFQAASAYSVIKMKKSSDKQISDLTEALAVTSNALASYKAFKMEAEKELGDEKSKEIKEAVTKEMINENPQTEENTVNKKPEANNVWCYWDQNGARYIWSYKSPTELKEWALEKSKNLYDGNIDGDRVNINEFYDFVAPNIRISGFNYNNEMFWYADDKNGQKDADLVDIDFYTTEGPDGRAVNAFECNFLPFRRR